MNGRRCVGRPETAVAGRRPGPAFARWARIRLPRSCAERFPMRHVGLRVMLALLLAIGIAGPSFAIQLFYIQYKKEYLDNHPDKEYAEFVNKAANRCFVCHQGKKNRKNRNPFGKQLAELLDSKKDAKDKEKIVAALKEVVAMHVDPKDDKSETYMDRIKASKWPGGEFEDLQREPEKQEGETQ
jgi:cytochrome c2